MDPSEDPDTAREGEQQPPARAGAARRRCKALAMWLDAASVVLSLMGRDSLALMARLSALPLRAISDWEPRSR